MCESRPQSWDSNYRRHIDRTSQLNKYNGLSPLAHKHQARRHLKGNECKTIEIQSHPAGIKKQRTFETAMTLQDIDTHNKSKNNQSTAQKKRDRDVNPIHLIWLCVKSSQIFSGIPLNLIWLCSKASRNLFRFFFPDFS
jgi:hypothetical protein